MNDTFNIKSILIITNLMDEVVSYTTETFNSFSNKIFLSYFILTDNNLMFVEELCLMKTSLISDIISYSYNVFSKVSD